MALAHTVGMCICDCSVDRSGHQCLDIPCDQKSDAIRADVEVEAFFAAFECRDPVMI